MDVFGNKNYQSPFRVVQNSLGQSTVEYILLIAVVVAISATIFKATDFNEIFGPNGTIATEYKDRLEYAYRHGLVKSGGDIEPNYNSGRHETYDNRFFSARDGYPDN